MPSVYLIVEVRAYGEALGQALRGEGLEVTGMAAHPLEALPGIRTASPDVALLDVAEPLGPPWAREIVNVAPATVVLALGVGQAERDVLAWAEAGVGGYVGREASLTELSGAIASAARGEAPCHPRTAAILLRHLATGNPGGTATWQCERHLTTREQEIVGLIAEGLSNHQIATRCHVALPTVKNHIHNILEKLGVHRRVDAVREIRRLGFIPQRGGVGHAQHPDPEPPELHLVSVGPG
jgi:DNA-binding NarL/FixJ family response regulator